MPEQTPLLSSCVNTKHHLFPLVPQVLACKELPGAALSSLRWKSPQDNQGSTSFTVHPFNDCSQDMRHPSPLNRCQWQFYPHLARLNAQVQLCAPGIHCHSSDSSLCQLMAPGLALAVWGWMGMFLGSLFPRQGTAWMHCGRRSWLHSVPGAQHVLAVRGRSSASMEMHLVTAVGKAPGQKVSLASRA